MDLIYKPSQDKLNQTWYELAKGLPETAFILWDFCVENEMPWIWAEQGVFNSKGSEPIMERGKVYFFQTLTFYYIARVQDFNPVHATVDKCVFILNTGDLELGEFLTTGKVKQAQKMPDGTQIPIGQSMYAPWAHPIPCWDYELPKSER